MVETFGAALRRLREQAGLSVDQLAEQATVHPVVLGDLEAGSDWPGRRETERLLAALGVTDRQRMRELAFIARGEQCPRCGFGGEEA